MSPQGCDNFISKDTSSSHIVFQLLILNILSYLGLLVKIISKFLNIFLILFNSFLSLQIILITQSGFSASLSI